MLGWMHSKQFAAGATPPPPPPPPDPQPRPVARCQPQPASPVPPQGRPPLGCSRWCDAQLPTCAAFPHSAMTAGHRRPLMSWQCNPSGVVQRWEPTGMGARQGGVATEVGRPGLCVPLAGRRPRLACTQGGRRRLAAGLTICSGRAPCMRCPAAAHHGMTPRIVDGCDCATPPPRGDSPSPAGQRSTRRPLHSGQAAPRSPPPPTTAPNRPTTTHLTSAWARCCRRHRPTVQTQRPARDCPNRCLRGQMRKRSVTTKKKKNADARPVGVQGTCCPSQRTPPTPPPIPPSCYICRRAVRGAARAGPKTREGAAGARPPPRAGPWAPPPRGGAAA